MKELPGDVFKRQLEQYRLPAFEAEHCFAKEVGRRHRWDFAWPRYMLAVEIQGFKVGNVRLEGGNAWRKCVVVGHFTPRQISDDCDKLNMGAMLGWSVLWFTENHVTSKQAIAVTQRVLTAKGWNR